MKLKNIICSAMWASSWAALSSNWLGREDKENRTLSYAQQG